MARPAFMAHDVRNNHFLTKSLARIKALEEDFEDKKNNRWNSHDDCCSIIIMSKKIKLPVTV